MGARIKIRNATQMDIFKEHRTSDKGTPAKAGEVYFGGSNTNRTRYRKVDSVKKLKAVLAQFQGVDKEIALCALRRVAKSNKLLTRDELTDFTYTLITTKHPSVKLDEVRSVLYKLSHSGGIRRVSKKKKLD